MDDRERRLAENEVAFRAANERVREAVEGFRLVTDEADFVCDCGRAECVETIRLPLDEYERIRSDPKRFVLVKGHERAEVERVVSDEEGCVVVEKATGRPARLAIKHDPRN